MNKLWTLFSVSLRIGEKKAALQVEMYKVNKDDEYLLHVG